MKLSIVTTLYYSAPYLQEFYARIKQAAETITDDYEIILVNDGSPDQSLETAVFLYNHDPHVKVIDLSRNFGHHKAAMTGLAHAVGELVFQIDVDLEEEPELLTKFYEIFEASDADAVYGVQDKRKGGLVERATGWLFYTVFNLLSVLHRTKILLAKSSRCRRIFQANANRAKCDVRVSCIGTSRSAS